MAAHIEEGVNLDTLYTSLEVCWLRIVLSPALACGPQCPVYFPSTPPINLEGECTAAEYNWCLWLV